MCMRARRLLMAGALLVGLSGSALAATHTVRLNGTGDFLAIQPAIDTCQVGDTVLVGPGTYTGAANRNLDFHGVDLALITELGRDQTIIDCQFLGRGIYLHSGETEAAVIGGLTIQNGRTTGNGGGIYCYYSGCTIRDSRIEACEALYAAGLLFSSSPRTQIVGTEIRGNSATAAGGGLGCSLSSIELLNVTIEGNHAAEAAGMRVDRCVVSCIQVRFVGNGTAAGGDGGGLRVELANTFVTLEDCLFRENTARWGAAIYCGTEVDLLDIRRCTVEANHATGSAGGLFVWGSTVNVEESLFHANQASYGGAMYFYDHANVTLTGCTIAGNTATNTAGGLRCVTGSNPILNRVIVAFNQGGGISSLNNLGGPQLACCDVWGNPGGDFLDEMVDPTGTNGNIGLDPLFCGGALNPESPYSLQTGSPCAAANNDCGVVMGTFDVGCVITGVESSSWGRIKSLY